MRFGVIAVVSGSGVQVAWLSSHVVQLPPLQPQPRHLTPSLVPHAREPSPRAAAWGDTSASELRAPLRLSGWLTVSSVAVDESFAVSRT